MMRIYWLSLALIATGAQAQMYKCDDANGRMVFSQLPCADEAETVDLNYAKPTEEQMEAARARAGAEAAAAEKALSSSRDRITRGDIATADAKTRRLQRERDAEMAKLRADMARANNNLAGAIWEKALAEQQRAIAERYNADIQIEQARISALRAQQSE